MWSPLYFNVTYSTITEQAHNNVVFILIVETIRIS